jgi:hypothetical protein
VVLGWDRGLLALTDDERQACGANERLHHKTVDEAMKNPLHVPRMSAFSV